MIKLILFVLLSFSLPVFAATDNTGSWSFGSIFSHIAAFFDMIENFIFIEIPLMVQRATEYFYYYAILLKIKSLMFFIEVSFGVAALLISDIGLASMLNSAISSLSQDMQAMISQLGFVRAFNIVIEAFIARYVMQFIY